MKTHRILTILASLALVAGVAPQLLAAPTADRGNVSVTFQDPDKFTDVHEDSSMTTSTYYLDELKKTFQEDASRLLASGQKLTITVTDVDLAGDNVLQSNPDHIRIMKDIYAPRVQLKFQLFDAGGKVLKEGTRNLTDTNYLHNLRLPGSSNEPLYYDKELIRQWVREEFRTKS